MIRRIFDQSIIQRAISARRRIADGPAELSIAWLREAGRFAIAEESGALLDPEDTPRLQFALKRAGVDRMLAVSNDPLVIDDQVYELGASVDDLNDLSSELGGMNILVFPAGALELAVLCTVDDFRLVAGSCEFVLAYADDLVATRDAFLDFVACHAVDELKPALHRAASYMDWIP